MMKQAELCLTLDHHRHHPHGAYHRPKSFTRDTRCCGPAHLNLYTIASAYTCEDTSSSSPMFCNRGEVCGTHERHHTNTRCASARHLLPLSHMQSIRRMQWMRAGDDGAHTFHATHGKSYGPQQFVRCHARSITVEKRRPTTRLVA